MGQRESRTSPPREYAGIQRSDDYRERILSCVGGDRAVTGAPPKYESIERIYEVLEKSTVL